MGNREYRLKWHGPIRWIMILGITTSLLLLFACAPKKNPAQQNPFFDEWRALAEKSLKASDASPPAVQKPQPASVLEEKTESAVDITVPLPRSAEAVQEALTSDRPLPDERISLKMHNVSIPVLLRALSKMVGLNMMISQSVRGEANINIQSAPWNRVFSAILHTYGLTYLWDGDILRVITAEDLEKELQLADKQRKIEEAEPLYTRVIPIRYSDAVRLKQNLQPFLSKNEKGSRGGITVDDHTRSLIVQGTQRDLETIETLVDLLDLPTRQILIEAHIVEANKDTARQLGVRWGGLYRGDRNYWITPGINSESRGGQEPSLTTPVDPGSGMIVNPDMVASGAGLNLGYIAQKLGDYLLTVQLSALQREGKLNILSSPSITTTDNQEAMIESGREVPYQTVEDDDVNVEFKSAVLSLKIIPHTIDEKTLKLEIETRKDELDFGNSVEGKPTIITKMAKTSVILFDGQTAVIGGLSKETTNDNVTGVPLLKDIPYLGYLFRGKTKSANMEEILIFITPHILANHAPEGPR